jgi:hypothetical protein
MPNLLIRKLKLAATLFGNSLRVSDLPKNLFKVLLNNTGNPKGCKDIFGIENLLKVEQASLPVRVDHPQTSLRVPPIVARPLGSQKKCRDRTLFCPYLSVRQERLTTIILIYSLTSLSFFPSSFSISFILAAFPLILRR